VRTIEEVTRIENTEGDWCPVLKKGAENGIKGKGDTIVEKPKKSEHKKI